MRIVIDMQGAQTESRFRGIGRYTMSFAKALILNGPQHEILLLCNGLFPDSIESIGTEFCEILPKENILTWFSPFPIYASDEGNDWRRGASLCIRQHFIESLKPDIVHISSMFEGYFDDAVVTLNPSAGNYLNSAILYDLIPLIHHFLDPASAVLSSCLARLDKGLGRRLRRPVECPSRSRLLRLRSERG